MCFYVCRLINHTITNFLVVSVVGCITALVETTSDVCTNHVLIYYMGYINIMISIILYEYIPDLRHAAVKYVSTKQSMEQSEVCEQLNETLRTPLNYI